MKTRQLSKPFLLLAVLAGAMAPAATAQELITNGGFEAGFSGWTRAEQFGSDGAFLIQTGALSPVTGAPVAPPPEGLNAAMTDMEAPGSRVLYQDFTVPSDATTGTLSFARFVDNAGPAFFSPDTLDFSTIDNQQARADIMLPTADPFSVAGSDILQTVFRTMPGDPAVSGYTTITADISALLAAHAGQTLRLRFAEVDNHLFLRYGVDRISLSTTPIPEPGTAALLAASLVPLMARKRRKA